MAVAVEAKLSSSAGSLEKLNELIEKRAKYLNITVKAAAVAAGVQIMKALKKDSRVAKVKGKYKGIVAQQMPWALGYRGKPARACIVQSLARGSARVVPSDGKVVFLHGDLKPNQVHVYRVTQEKVILCPLYIVAKSKADAIAYAAKATSHRIEAKGSLASNAIGVAIQKLHEASPLDGGAKAKNIASQLSNVEVREGQSSCYVHIQDDIAFTTEALRHGESFIDAAIQKVGSKLYGMLATFAQAPFTQSMPSNPFK